MILLWGISADGPLMAVNEALHRRGANVAFLDQQAVLETEVEMTVGETVNGSLRVGDQTLELGAITSVYLRPYESLRVPAVERAGSRSEEARHAVNVEDVLVSWSDITPGLVVNRPTAMAANSSKPFQAAQILASGFAIPDTLITTDPEAVREFQAKHGTVIYKSISAARSIVSRLTPDQMDHLDDVRWCPTQFQEYIPGKDYRVHVVGDEVFACEIESRSDDYRYSSQEGNETQFRACELPDDCAALCIKLAKLAELPVAGIDLRRGRDESWYCFEVNPSPGFTFFQDATDQPIDEAVAQLLIAGPST